MELMEWSPTNNPRKKSSMPNFEKEDRLRRKSMRKESVSPKTTTKKRKQEKPLNKTLTSIESIFSTGLLSLDIGSGVGRQGICRFCADGVLYETTVAEQTGLVGEGILEIYQTGERNGRLDFSTEMNGIILSMELDLDFIVKKGISPRMVVLNEQYIIKLSNLVSCQELVHVITAICSRSGLCDVRPVGERRTSRSNSRRLCDSPMQLCDC